MDSVSHASSGRFERSPLFGRERELDALREALEQALLGHGGLVLVSGEAGIGKTSLVRALAQEAEEREAFVLHGYCYDSSSTPPYGLWLDVTDRYPVDGSYPELPELMKRGTGIGDASSQLEIFVAVRDFLGSLSADYPLVLILEDLHWADRASLDLLRYLARYVEDYRILLVATYRNDEVTREHPFFTLLPALVRETRETRVELGALSRSSVLALVTARWPLSARDRERLADYLVGHTEGHPLFTVEVLRTLEQHGFIHDAADGWRLSDLNQVPLPPLIHQVIEARLIQLSEEARQWLEAAAVIGQHVPLSLWQVVAGLSDDDLLKVLDQAISAHLLEAPAQGNAVSFVHALTRDVLYAGILPPRRRRWHCLIAETLARSPNPLLDDVAHHFQQADDPRALDWLIRAGDRAEHSFAWSSALDRFRAASPLLEADAARTRERGWLLFRTARLSYYIDPAGGVEHLDEAIRISALTGDDVLHAVSMVHRGHLRCFTADIQRGIQEMAKGIESWDLLSFEQKRSCDYLNVVGSDLQLNLYRGTLMLWLALVGRYHECLQHADAFLSHVHLERKRLAERRRSIPWPDGYVGLGLSQSAMGRPDRAREMFELARTWFHPIGHHNMVSISLMNIVRDVLIPYQSERVPERHRLADEIVAAWIRAEGGMRSLIPPGLQIIRLLMLDGSWEEARELARVGMVAHKNVARRVELMPVLGTVARYQGDTKLAWEQVRSGLPRGSDTEPGNSVYMPSRELVALAAQLAIDDGNLTEARTWLQAHDDWLTWSGAVRGRAEAALLWARHHAASDDVEVARQHAERSLKLAEDPRQPFAIVAARLLLGELETLDGRYAAAETHLQASLELAEACAAPFEVAVSKLALAELRAAERSVEEARTLLDEVISICTPLGARPTLERAERLRKALSPRREFLPFGLTSREMEVLELLIQGMPDREIGEALFISRHTVMRHVSSVLRKLDVDSRTAAASKALRMDLTSHPPHQSNS